jgi:hypothetical protein
LKGRPAGRCARRSCSEYAARRSPPESD